jgi:hypothetical protein
MADNESVYEYLLSIRELVDSGGLSEEETEILCGNVKSINTLLGEDEDDSEYYPP